MSSLWDCFIAWVCVNSNASVNRTNKLWYGIGLRYSCSISEIQFDLTAVHSMFGKLVNIWSEHWRSWIDIRSSFSLNALRKPKWQSKLVRVRWKHLPDVTKSTFYRMKNASVLIHSIRIHRNCLPEAVHCNIMQYFVQKSTRMAHFALHENVTKVDCVVLIKRKVSGPQVSYYGQQFMVGEQATSQKPKLKAFTTAQLAKESNQVHATVTTDSKNNIWFDT